MTAPDRSRPAVFLDRDGVINEVVVRNRVPRPPPTLAELHLLPGVADACRDLRDAGFSLVVVTNQPDIARGTQDRAEVDRMHDRLRELLPLDDICMCPHDDIDGCECRKPKPGLIVEAASRLGLDLSRSACVGDRWRDVEAARRAGVRAIHIERGYGERRVFGADAVLRDLPDAARWIRESDLCRKGAPGV